MEALAVGHTDDLLALFLDPAVAEWYGPWTREQVAREAARSMRSWSIDEVGKWMAHHRATGAPVGRGGLSRQQVDGIERLELGWALHHRFCGQGYATEIGAAGLTFAFDELGAKEVASFTEARNTRSWAVMQRLGFRYRKDIRLHDELFALYLLNRAPKTDPNP